MEFSKKWLICSALVSLALITGVIGWVLGKIL